MLLRFIGKNGSLGLRKGELYPVEIKSQLLCDCINTRILVGEKWVNCPYASPQAFAANWEKAGG